MIQNAAYSYSDLTLKCPILLFIIFRTFRVISIEEYSFKKGGRERRFFPASLLFALHSTVSLTALHGMNIPMYTAIKVLSNHPSFIFQ